jgi:hypothetical protein
MVASSFLKLLGVDDMAEKEAVKSFLQRMKWIQRGSLFGVDGLGLLTSTVVTNVRFLPGTRRYYKNGRCLMPG